MSSSLSAPRSGRARIAPWRGIVYRAVHWPGWPACSSGARVVGIGFLLLTLVLIASGMVITHALAHSVGRWDNQVSAMFARHRTPHGTWLTGYLTVLANAPAIVGVALVACLVAAVIRRARIAVVLVIGLAVELAAFLASNYAVARPRPHVKHLGTTPSTYSWPSGHVGATFVLYAGIALLVAVTTRRLFPRILAWVVAAALTASVAVSRIYRGEHHPTDAVAGLLLGAGALLIATLAVRAWAPQTAHSERGTAVPTRSGIGGDTATVP